MALLVCLSDDELLLFAPASNHSAFCGIGAAIRVLSLFLILDVEVAISELDHIPLRDKLRLCGL